MSTYTYISKEYINLNKSHLSKRKSLNGENVIALYLEARGKIVLIKFLVPLDNNNNNNNNNNNTSPWNSSHSIFIVESD